MAEIEVVWNRVSAWLLQLLNRRLWCRNSRDDAWYGANSVVRKSIYIISILLEFMVIHLVGTQPAICSCNARRLYIKMV